MTKLNQTARHVIRIAALPRPTRESPRKASASTLISKLDPQPPLTWTRARQLDHAAVAAVPKKDGRQRKILAVVPKNARWGPPRRSSSLGLGGGESLTRILAPFGLHSGSIDLENAFSYIVWMPWVWKFQGTPQSVP